MKRKLFFKLFVFAVIAAFVTVTSCKDYDDDIKKLEGQISGLQAELPSKIDAVKTELNTALDAKIKTVNDGLAELKGKLADMEKNGATKAELDAVKKEILEKTVALEVYNTFKAKTEADLKDLSEKITKAATKAELEAYKTEVTQQFGKLNTTLTNLGVDVKKLRTDYDTFMGDYKGNVAGILKQITDLEGKLNTRIVTLESILNVKDGKSEVIADIYGKLKAQLAKIEANEKDITAVKADLQVKYKELQGVDKDLQAQISANKDEIGKIKTRLDKIEKDIEKLETRIGKAEVAIDLNMANMMIISGRVTDLTFIPTRGLPGEKTIKLYWNAGDYTANHVLMYRVSPATAVVGKDFAVESLNYQITTRAAKAIDDHSSNVDVTMNGTPYMLEGASGILCVPVHIQGKEACDVFEVGADEALTLVLTVKNLNVKAKKEDADKFDVYVKSSEMVYTHKIHNDINLAELGNKTLSERLLETTEIGAKAFANKPEVETPAAKRNWNAMLYKLGQIDLNDYVLSYYVDEKGENHFYDEIGKFGKPYTDVPMYAKPEYKFEIVTEWQGSAPHFIDPQDRYTELVDGSILKVKKGKVNSADDKKVIIKVTQVNSKCEERQPVAYLVVKITNDPSQAWADIHHTFDLTAYPYIHSDKDGYVNNPDDFTFGKNPADIDVVLDKFPVGGIKKEEFWNSTYVTGWPSIMDYVSGSAKFTPFEYNKVTLTPDEALQYIRFEPTKTWGPGDEYQVNSILVKVDKRAPAGMYEVTYKTRYTRGVPAVQAGPDLYITFKFQVGVRKMTVTKDMTLWTGNTLNVQYARKDNTIGYDYKSENGYKANLTQAFIHDAGTKLITVATDGTKDHGDKAFDARTQSVYGSKNAPVYAPMFEFIPQEALTKAGFSYETETINGNEYLTQLMYGDKRAAHIFKDPADYMIRLYIEYNEAGDMLYNWINTIDPTKVYNSSNKHNKVFNAEKVLNVRMVTDINDSKIGFNKFYLHDFDVKFERTLHARFTTIALNDKQAMQIENFNFLTKDPSKKVYRGLFDEDENLVGGQESWQTGNPLAFAQWYNVQTNVTLPVNSFRPDAVDYDKVEYSEDGITWEPIRKDLRADTHPTRYFDIKWVGHSDHKTWQAVWQGDEKVSTKDIYFRVPVVNEQGKAKGLDTALFRFDEARVQGYAVFKINKRK